MLFQISKNLTLSNIKQYFKNRNEDSSRAGWYFQQFIKLSISKLNYISNLYLIWDADAVVLKPINFLTKGNKIYLEKNKEYHKPYFDILEKLIGLEKQTNYSFIAEYLLFNKEIVNTIISKISTKEEWWDEILDNIDSDNLSKSGFSEYELYGNYIYKYHKNSFEIRNLNKSRKGVKLLGNNPTKKDLKQLSLAYDYMSFEQFHKKYKPLSLRLLLIFFTISFGILRKLIKF